MKNLFYILIFGIVYHFSAISVARAKQIDEKCLEVMRAPEVTISTSLGKLRYDFSKNTRTLTRMHLKQYGGSVLPNHQVNGLSTYNLAVELNFKINKNNLMNGTVCLYPSDIELNIGLKDPTIYIANHLEPDSCLYDLTLRHEQTHQQITTEILEHYLPIIQQRFLDTIKHHSFVSRDTDVSLTLARESLRKLYLSVINPLIDEINAEISSEQSKLDNPEHYAYENSICNQM